MKKWLSFSIALITLMSVYSFTSALEKTAVTTVVKKSNKTVQEKSNFQGKVKNLVDGYYLKLKPHVFSMEIATSRRRDRDHCNDRTSPSCFDVACSLVDPWDCDDLEEVTRLQRDCRGNYNGLCLKTLCSKVGFFGCDDIEEIAPLAAACIGNIDGSCVESVCSKLSPFDCDDEDEVILVAKSCSGRHR